MISGVTRGIGRAMALRFAELGHVVAGCGRSAGEIRELARRLPPPHDFDVVDVTFADAVAAWAEATVARAGPPDLLVANAALINRSAPLWEVPPEEFSRVVDANVKGVHHLVRAFAPAMLRRGRGVIVAMSSGWGRSTSPEVAPYCATKWAVEGLLRALAQELPSGMAAIPLNPGIINTEMLQSCFGASAADYPCPEEWASRAVPFLLGLGPEHNGRPLSVPG